MECVDWYLGLKAEVAASPRSIMRKAEQRGTCEESVSPSPRMTKISRFARNDDAGKSDVS